MCVFSCREGLLAFGTDEGRVGWVEALQQRQPTYSKYQHRGGVYSVTWGPALGEEEGGGGGGEVLLYTVGEGKIIQHNTRTSMYVDIQVRYVP
jgi:hypothetical protein